MHVRRGLISLTCLAAAPVLFLQGYANAEMLPGPPGWNGFWEADISRAFLQIEQVDQRVDISVGEQGVEFARDAWSKEPLASDALSVLVIDARARGETENLEQLLDLSGQLERRNRFLGALRMEAALQDRDLETTFALLDQFSRANPRSTNDLVAPIMGILSEQGSVEILSGILTEEPDWAPAFWNAVPSDPVRVGRLYELRRSTDIGTSPDTDIRLLAGLVDGGLYSQAFDFLDEVMPDIENPFGYRADTQFAPIGWRVISTGERALSARNNGLFELYVEDQTQGEVARQLVRLPVGSYAFSARITPLSEAENVTLTMACAENDEVLGSPQSLEGTARFAVDGSCEYFWLVLSGSAWERSRPLRAGVSDMELTQD